MKKYLNISLLCYSLPSNHVWAYGETVDTPVLGTGLARGESSNLSTPTRFAIILGLIASVVSKFLIKFVAVNVALRTKCCSTERVCIEGFSSRRLVRLRNYPPNLYILTTAYFSAIPTCFF